MKISVLSDLHLEFGPMDPGEGEVLILAGDICTAVELNEGGELCDSYHEFFNTVSRNYDRVYYVKGNHESYHYRFDLTTETLRDHLPSNIILLDNNSEYYNGVHFVGATLWADFNNDDKEMKELAGQCMNDYRTTHLNASTMLAPVDTLIEHDNTVVWFNQVLPTLKMGKIVVVTHHAPSLQSVDPNYNPTLSGAYASDLEDLIKKHSPDLWVHGHIHGSRDYMVGDTRIVSNPRGYVPHATNRNFDPNFMIEL